MSLLATEKLDSKEADEYAKCKYLIQEHQKTWRSFAEAMKKVRDQRLYRQEFKTFDAFCEAQGLYEKRSIDRMIQAYNISLDLGRRCPKKLTESIVSMDHWLALKDVSEERVESVFKRIEKDSNGKPVTTSIIKKAIHGPTGKPAIDAKTKADPVDGKVVATVSPTTSAVNDEPISQLAWGEPDKFPIKEFAEKVAANAKARATEYVSRVIIDAPPEIVDASVTDKLRALMGRAGLQDILAVLLEVHGSQEDRMVIANAATGGFSPTAVILSPGDDEINQMTETVGQVTQGGLITIDKHNALEMVVSFRDPEELAEEVFTAINTEAQEAFVKRIADLWKGAKKGSKVKIDTGTFVRPSQREVDEYIESEGVVGVTSDEFYNYFEAQGWKLSNGTAMKNWQAAVKQWAAREKKRNAEKQGKTADIPTLEQVEEYAKEINAWLQPSAFYDHYQGCGWMVKAGVPVTDWRAAFRKIVANPRNDTEKALKAQADRKNAAASQPISTEPEMTDEERHAMVMAKIAKIPKTEAKEPDGTYLR